MATPILNFTISYDTVDKSKIILTDTTEYDEEFVVTQRSWTISDTTGVLDEVFPVALTDKVATYTLDGDHALIIKMNINKTLISPGISKSINVLAANTLFGALYDLEKRFLDIRINMNEKQMKEFIHDLKVSEYFYKSARRLISTDITASQKALDAGNQQSIICNCG